MKSRFYLRLFLLFSLLVYIQGYASILPTGFTESRLATGLDPTGVTTMPDGRILVTIKSGKILVLKNSVLLSTPFLTISNVDNFNERGLLNVVIDPNFATNHFIYVYYTFKNTSTNISNNRVSRFTINGDVAVPGSELVLINFDNLSTVGWHNGGGLVYGADGKLYMSTGENTVASNSQSFTTLLGKVLRINPDGTIPADNPYFNTTTGKNKAIYALGFRNPFKMKIQPGTGKIFVNDVGASTWEEINELVAGKNYGWPVIEGKRTNQVAPANYKDPAYTYDHSNGNCSITGSTFYNPATQQFPAQYAGKYFIADYCGGWIRYVDPSNNFALSNFASGVDRPLDLATDNAGNLYYISRGGLGGGSDADNTSSSEGELWRVTFTGSGAVSITVNPQNKTVAAGGRVSFVMSASGAAPLQYQWKKNGVDIPGANTSVFTIDSALLSDNGSAFSIVVSNANSSKTSTAAILTVVQNTAPVPVILTPVEGTLYEAATTFGFSGTANDAEDGTLPASAFTWLIELHHDTHTHPAMDAVSGITSGSFSIPDGGETSDNVWFRITLTVRDALGTTTTIFRDIFPKKVNVTLGTVPAGIPLKLDGTAIATPFTFTGVVGLKRSIGADSMVSFNGVTYAFSGWSNNGTATQTISTPNVNTTYTATYVVSTSNTLTPVADAYVKSGVNANTTFGTTDATQLQSKNTTSADLVRRSYLRFDISQASALITTAKLRLFGRKNSTESNNIMVSVSGVSNLTWNETTITWNNKPALNASVIGTVVVNALPTAGQYYEWDVSAYVKAAKQAGATAVSFCLSNPATSTSYVFFNSKEASANKPQLIVTGGNGTSAASINVVNNIRQAVVAPNPTRGLFTLTVHEPVRFIRVADAISGTGVLTLETSDASERFEFGNNLPAGIYILNIHYKSGRVETKRIQKIF
jgi:glucose/arabinose dehydrogenase